MTHFNLGRCTPGLQLYDFYLDKYIHNPVIFSDGFMYLSYWTHTEPKARVIENLSVCRNKV